MSDLALAVETPAAIQTKGSISMKAVKLEMGVLRQEAGGRRQEKEGKRKKERGRRKEPEEVFLQI
ncbi:hypothetical protein QUB49_09460 [Microcoleus sp. AT9_B4]